MRVLVLSNTPFLPATAGNRARIGGLVDHLTATGHEVGMLMLAAVDRAEWDVVGMRARLAWLEVATDDGSSAVRWGRKLAQLRRRLGSGGRRGGMDDWCPAWFRARARARIREWGPDVVVVEYVFLSACLVDLGTAHPRVTVIDTHDVMHRRRGIYDALDMEPQWFQTTRAEERRGLLRADIVLAIQDEEAAILRALVPERRVLVVPHGGPVRPAREDAARPDRLLLVASYNDLNVRGVAWLARDVWPTLRAAVPGVELAICGNVAAKLGPMPAGIVARGFVPSLEEEYEAARVVLCPSPGGTGLAVKAVDALCHGRPVVCTPAATAGLAIGETAGVFVADRADDFAAAVRALLADDRLWRRAVAGAAAQAAARFAPEAAFAPLVDELTQCLARSSAGCRA